MCVIVLRLIVLCTVCRMRNRMHVRSACSLQANDRIRSKFDLTIIIYTKSIGHKASVVHPIPVKEFSKLINKLQNRHFAIQLFSFLSLFFVCHSNNQKKEKESVK